MKNEITLNEHEGMSITEEMAIKQSNNILNWKTADRECKKHSGSRNQSCYIKRFSNSWTIFLMIIPSYISWMTFKENSIAFNPNQGEKQGNFTLPCWFSLDISETVEVVTLALCSIQ